MNCMNTFFYHNRQSALKVFNSHSHTCSHTDGSVSYSKTLKDAEIKPPPPKLYLLSHGTPEARISSCGLTLAPSCMEHLNLLNCELRVYQVDDRGVMSCSLWLRLACCWKRLNMTQSRPEQPSRTLSKK